MAIVNYYEALGVARDAAPATVRSAYKKLMLQCHPDKVHDETLRAEKAKQFREVQEAYEILSDARKRRKHDEELDRKGGAAAGSGATGSGEDVKREKDRERHERRRRRAEEAEPNARRSRADPSFNVDEAEREARKAYRAEREQRERERERERERDRDREHHHRRDEVPLPKHRDRHTYSTTGSRYAEETSRKTSGYERSRPQDYPHTSGHSAPPASEPRVPPAPESEASPAVRPGYEEKRLAEEAKLEAVRRRTREAQGLPTGTPRTHRSNSHESEKTAQAEEFRRAEQQRIRQEEEQRRERERRKAAKAAEVLSERFSRPTDIPTPTARPRKTSASPLGRRRGSSVSKDDFVFGTPPYTGPGVAKSGISGSVPTASAFGYGSPPHVGGPGYPQVRRRHSVSSPSLEKQAARPHRQAQPPPPPSQQHQQDSGYSSPSSPNDVSTPITFEKKHVSSNLNPGGSAIHQHQGGGWKKYIVYVQEDGTTTTAPPGKASSAGSPESSHAEPIHLEYDQPAGPPLPTDFFIKAGLANGGNIFVQNAGYAIPVGSGYAASATSHSSHSSPRVPPQRHHNAHQSPRMGGAGFDDMSSMHTIPPSPGLSRASTTYSTPGSRRAAPVYASPGFPPAFARGQTWNM